MTPLPYGSAREILGRMRSQPVPSGFPLYAADLSRHARSLEQRAETLGSPLALDDLHAAVATLDIAVR